MPKEGPYTVVCVTDKNGFKPFVIQIDSSQLVGTLKKMIKDEDPSLSNIAAHHLKLYKVEIPRSANIPAVASKKLTENPGELPDLDEMDEAFVGGPKKRMVHIIVQVPKSDEAHKQNKTPENRPGCLPDPELIPTRTTQLIGDAQARIDLFLRDLRPIIKDYLAHPNTSHWTPPDKAPQETKEFYARLKIPSVEQYPNLLLHALRESPNPNGEAMFSERRHRILCNTSGSGKTRLLFEGLTKHWGFYLVCRQGPDKIGSQDLEGAMSELCDDTFWTKDIFRSREATGIQSLNSTNENIAIKAMLKILLARWSIFRLFIEEAREQGRPVEDLKEDWLMFQIFPPTLNGNDPFVAAFQTLLGVSLGVLQLLRPRLNPQIVLGSQFNRESDRFFYVVDEIQVAATLHQGSFCNENGKARPVLRPMIRTLSSDSADTTVIVSGTGFSLSDFKALFVSSVGKADNEWTTEYSTGDFTNSSIQSSYIERYLPASYLNSPSGLVLMRRMRRWLCGRHRFTAAFIQELLSGGWDEAGPLAPHTLLGLYILRISSFNPGDDEGFLLREKSSARSAWTKVGEIRMNTFQWDKISEKPGLLQKLSYSFYSWVLRGRLPISWENHQELVEYGLARFILPRETSMLEPSVAIEDQLALLSRRSEPSVVIGEPLALLSIMKHFHCKGFTLSGHIERELLSNQGPGFEDVLVFVLTKLLQQEGYDLKALFKFFEIPQWASSKAQIVARSASGTFEAFRDHQLVGPTTEVVFHADTPADVKNWLEHGEAPWCRPGAKMGPDLLTRVRLDDERVLLLVIQAKCHLPGNIKTITAHYTATAINKVTPSYYFVRGHVSSEIEAMLNAINPRSARFTTGRYNILRVVAAFPLDADFSSTSTKVQNALNEDNHALAQLAYEKLICALTDPEGELILPMLSKAVKRPLDNADDSGRAPKKVNRGNKGQTASNGQMASRGQRPNKGQRASKG